MKFKPFQFEQIATAALVDGLIGDWEPGLGKMIFALAWARLKGAQRCLIVAPGQLHHQFRIEALEKFGIHLLALSHHKQIRKYGLHKPLQNSKFNIQNSTFPPTRFFLTSYHELGLNNTAHGTVPTLARQIADLGPGAGFDCVVVDEGTRLQGDETLIATGVRLLEPRFRLVLTGTPIKNRLESIFWLLWWVAGAGNPTPEVRHARFPYPGTPKGRDTFANAHLAIERATVSGATLKNGNMSLRHESRRTARLTNVHHLWSLLAPLLIRMRKADCGEPLPPKILKPILLQPGTTQARVYHQHLHHPPLFAQSGRATTGFGRVAMQLNLLRQAALCPHAAALGRVKSAGPGPRRSSTDFNPKLAANLALIADLLHKGEQVLVGSPFRDYSDALHYRLREAGVSSLLLDGRTQPAPRGELVEGFKNGKFAVLIAGMEAMGEGYNLDNCRHAILPSLSWAMDVNAQFVERIYRLTSKKEVTIYTLLLAGTIDEKLYEGFAEKTGSAQLAIDRTQFSDPVEEVNLNTLFKYAVRAFKDNGKTIDESSMEAQWTAKLRSRLTGAERRYREKRTPTHAGAPAHRAEVDRAFASLRSRPNPLSIAIRKAKPIN